MIPTRNRTGRARRFRRSGAAVLGSLRAARALVGCALAGFLVCFVAAPCLHNLDHHDDHVHEPDGSVAPGRQAWRSRLAGLLEEAHAHPHPHPHAQPAEVARVAAWAARQGTVAAEDAERPGRHGHGAAAHFGVAVTPTPVFVAPPPAMVAGAIDPPPATGEAPRTPAPRTHEARGPPRA